jgi:tetratricopeptide (TPR) repeat protein
MIKKNPYTLLLLLLSVGFLFTNTVFAQNVISGSAEKLGITNAPAISKKSTGKVYDTKNPLSLAYSENFITKISTLVKTNKLQEAHIASESIIEWLENSTEYHASLYQTLKSIENANDQADAEKELALKSALLRDKAYYETGMLYLKQNRPKDAIEMFVNIVKSQPKTDLGFKAYEELQKIGFTYKVQFTQQPAVIE